MTVNRKVDTMKLNIRTIQHSKKRILALAMKEYYPNNDAEVDFGFVSDSEDEEET